MGKQKGSSRGGKAKRQQGRESKRTAAGGEKAKGQLLGERKQKDGCWEMKNGRLVKM